MSTPRSDVAKVLKMRGLLRDWGVLFELQGLDVLPTCQSIDAIIERLEEGEDLGVDDYHTLAVLAAKMARLPGNTPTERVYADSVLMLYAAWNCDEYVGNTEFPEFARLGAQAVVRSKDGDLENPNGREFIERVAALAQRMHRIELLIEAGWCHPLPRPSPWKT